MNEDLNKIYGTIINKFGENSQLIKVLEELSELQKEIAKMLLGKSNGNEVIEEIADVEIMLGQLKLILCKGDLAEFKMVSGVIEKVKLRKIDRTMKKIME